MFGVLSDPRIYTYLPGNPPPTLERLRERYAFQSRGESPDGQELWFNWILFLRESGEPIGFVQATVRAAHAAIAYVLNPKFWGHGYATEACTALVSHLFERFEGEVVRAEVHVDNQPSLTLVKSLGFSFVEHDSEENDDVYEVTRTAWEATHH